MARFSSYPHAPQEAFCENSKQLIELITTHGWSPMTFSGYRKGSNYTSSTLAVLDIDEDLTIEEAKSRVEELDIFCICMPTASHKESHHKFRLMFPLSRTIFKPSILKSTMKELFKHFPESDTSCLTDVARFYFPCQTAGGFVHSTNNLLEPSQVREISPTFNRTDNWKKITATEDHTTMAKRLYGDATKMNIPYLLAHFMDKAHTGFPGEWNNILNKLCYTLGMIDIPFDLVYNIIETYSPEELDLRDELTIEKSWERGQVAKQNKKRGW